MTLLIRSITRPLFAAVLSALCLVAPARDRDEGRDRGRSGGGDRGQRSEAPRQENRSRSEQPRQQRQEQPRQQRQEQPRREQPRREEPRKQPSRDSNRDSGRSERREAVKPQRSNETRRQPERAQSDRSQSDRRQTDRGQITRNQPDRRSPEPTRQAPIRYDDAGAVQPAAPEPSAQQQQPTRMAPQRDDRTSRDQRTQSGPGRGTGGDRGNAGVRNDRGDRYDIQVRDGRGTSAPQRDDRGAASPDRSPSDRGNSPSFTYQPRDIDRRSAAANAQAPSRNDRNDRNGGNDRNDRGDRTHRGERDSRGGSGTRNDRGNGNGNGFNNDRGDRNDRNDRSDRNDRHGFNAGPGRTRDVHDRDRGRDRDRNWGRDRDHGHGRPHDSRGWNDRNHRRRDVHKHRKADFHRHYDRDWHRHRHHDHGGRYRSFSINLNYYSYYSSVDYYVYPALEVVQYPPYAWFDTSVYVGVSRTEFYLNRYWYRPRVVYHRAPATSFFFFVDLGAYETRGVPVYVRDSYASARWTHADVFQATDWQGIAYARFAQGDYLGSITAFDNALALDRYDGVLYFGRAQAKFATGWVEQSYADLTTGLRLVPDWPEVKMNLFELYDDPQELDAQINRLESWVAANPGSPEGHFVLGYMYYFTQWYEAANDELLDALDLEPGNAVTMRLLDAIAARRKA